MTHPKKQKGEFFFGIVEFLFSDFSIPNQK